MNNCIIKNSFALNKGGAIYLNSVLESNIISSKFYDNKVQFNTNLENEEK